MRVTVDFTATPAATCHRAVIENEAKCFGLPLLIDAGHFLFAWRNIIFPVVLLAAGIGTRPAIFHGSMPADHWLDAAGFLLAAGGQALRIIVLGLRYVTRAGQNRRIYADVLEEGGIFAHCRNPLYIGNLMILTGLAIVHNGWAMYFVVLPLFVVAYSALIRAEEEYLEQRFGDDYRRYCERVPRWWPILHHWRGTFRGAKMSWRRVLRQEYGTPAGWLSGFLLLLMYEHRSPLATPLGATERNVLIAAWAMLAAAYATTRILKRTGRLEGD